MKRLITSCAVVITSIGVTAPAIAQPSLLALLQTERAKYQTPMQPAQIGQLLNDVAAKGGPEWRLLSKPAGNHCPSPVGFISCDYLVYAPTGQGFDVLQDEDGATIPVWNRGDAFTPDRLLRPAGDVPPTPPPPSPLPQPQPPTVYFDSNAIAQAVRAALFPDFDRIYQQNERVYADETSQHASNQDALIQRIDQPGWFMSLVKNPIFISIASVAATCLPTKCWK